MVHKGAQSLGYHQPVHFTVYSMNAGRTLEPLAIRNAPCKSLDQTVPLRSLTRVFDGRNCTQIRYIASRRKLLLQLIL